MSTENIKKSQVSGTIQGFEYDAIWIHTSATTIPKDENGDPVLVRDKVWHRLLCKTYSNKVAELKLEDIFPSGQWAIEPTKLPIHIFRRVDSELRIALLPGLYPGTDEICGYYVLYRHEEDEINMEISCPDAVMLKSVVNFATDMTKGKHMSNDKFLANLERWLAEKTRITQLGKVRPPSGKSPDAPATDAPATDDSPNERE